MVYKILWDAAKWSTDFTLGLGKAAFSHKSIKTLPPKQEHLVRLPAMQAWYAEFFRLGAWKLHWIYYPTFRMGVYSATIFLTVYYFVLPSKPRDKYLKQIADIKSHKSHVHHFRGKYQRDEDHHYWEHYHKRKPGEVDEALLRNAKHSDEYLNHGPMAISH